MDKKRQALEILKDFYSDVYIINKNLILIDGSKYSLCQETHYFVIKDNKYYIYLDAEGLAIQKAFRLMKDNSFLYSNL